MARGFVIKIKWLPIVLGLLLGLLWVDLARAVSVEPNELGMIPVLEYHRIGDEEGAYKRSRENFRKDLEWLYNNDYRLIKLEDFMAQRFNVPAGKKPLIMTFDDAVQSQFDWFPGEEVSLAEGKDLGAIDPDSAIGILDEFYEEHPDFGRAAVFFLNPGFFGQSEYVKAKFQYLLDTGRELGNHTYTHASLKQLGAVGIQEEIGKLGKTVMDVLGTRPWALDALAYPFGAVPYDNFAALEEGVYEDYEYAIQAAFLVGAEPAWVPYHVKFEALMIPRIQADDSEFKRWFGRAPGQTEYTDSEVFYPFVSDGDSATVTILAKDEVKLVKSAVVEGLTVRVLEEGETIEVAEPEEEPEEEPEPEIVSEGEEPSDEPEEKAHVPMEDETLDEGGLVEIEVGTGAEIGTGATVEPDFPPIGQLKKWLNLYSPGKMGSHLRQEWQNFVQRVKEPFSRVTFNWPAGLEFKLTGFYYLVEEGDTLSGIAVKLLADTKYRLKSELVDAISEHLDGYLQAGDEILIPGVELVRFDFPFRPEDRKGIYWTGYTAGNRESVILLERLVKAGGNMVIFDVKETAGEIFYDTQVELAHEIDVVNVKIPDMPKLVRWLHQNGVYAVARQTVFKDRTLAQMKPEYAIRDRQTGGAWANREGVVWVDPSLPAVQDYNIAIAKEVAALGVDEIQFDYIRFPTLGNVSATQYYYEEENPDAPKYEIIAAFLKRAHEELAPYDAKLSIDVYGIMAWNDGYDAISTGQKMEELGPYVDVVYPMVYPSHFGAGFAGHADPANEPYFFVQESTRKFQEILAPWVEAGTLDIVPWIQGFTYQVDNYGTWYVKDQLRAAHDIGIDSYAIWNAGNRYDYSFPAMGE